MFFSKRFDQLSNRQMQPGETLFQYLKRKKHIALKQSLQSSFEKAQSPKKQILIITKNMKEKQAEMEPLQSGRAVSTRRKNRKSSNKKRKVDSSFDSKNSKKENNMSLLNVTNEIFKDEKSTKRAYLYKKDDNFCDKIIDEYIPRSRTPTRSFISMISPLKNRQNVSSLSNTKPLQKVASQQQKKSSISQMAEHSTKRMVKQAISKVQKHYNQQVQFQKGVKQRIREFFIMLNSLFVQLDDEPSLNERVEKKLIQLRSNIKLINGFISGHSTNQSEDIQRMIDSLYIEINQVLDKFQGQVHKQSRSTCQQSMQSIKRQYQQKIEELTKEKTRLSREITLVSKESGKLEREYNRLLEKLNKVEVEGASKQQSGTAKSQQITRSFEQQIKNLSAQNQSLSQKLKLIQKKLKQSEYIHEQHVRKSNLDHEQKLNERQAYLLRQINLLKEQCANDINNINKYYLVKLQQYPLKIKGLEDIIEEQRVKVNLLMQKLKDTQSTLKREEAKFIEVRRKTENTVLDMCRINEELFKHWLALKDVKTLLTRLGMFDKFQRIYRDIPFDDLLFLL